MPAKITNHKGGTITLEGNTPREVERLRDLLFGSGSVILENSGRFVIRVHPKTARAPKRRVRNA